ncbi:MAG TPA: IS4 family transposase [Campylobacterales bacterium]|nr:IS4 family transposase [Campylobacterales bacterium]
MEHIEELKKVFEKYYDWHEKRVSILGNFISALIRSRSVNLQKVAENIEGKAKTASNYRRIQRLFKEQEVDYKVTAKLLSSILPNDEKWVLTMDRTNWKLGKSNVNLLVLGVAYKGMAIPLIWDFLTIEEEVDNETIERGKRGNSNTEERKDLLKEFVDIFGVEKIEALTADREFIGQEWFDWLKEKKIPFVIRVKSNILIDENHLGSRDVKELFSHTNKDEFYTFGEIKLFGTDLYLGGIRATKSEEALILVSDHKMDNSTISTYQKRWEIETLFGALKSKGFNFEESKLTEGYKIEKLMAFLSIAFVWSILAGDYRELEKPIPLKKRALSN